MNRVIIDMEQSTVTVTDKDGERVLPMNSAEAFNAASDAWLRCGWDVKHIYSFTWLGRPMLQLPEDMIRLQELIWQLQPDVIIETGVALGGSISFSASMCELMGKGHVIGVERGLYPHIKEALKEHPFAARMTVVEGDSAGTEAVEKVRSMVKPGDKVLVLLDSNHSHDHVLAELRAYGPLVSKGSYIIACDGIMRQVKGGPRTFEDWDVNNPITAADDFLAENDAFERVQPAFLFNEGVIDRPVTYWPQGFLQRVRD